MEVTSRVSVSPSSAGCLFLAAKNKSASGQRMKRTARTYSSGATCFVTISQLHNTIKKKAHPPRATETDTTVEAPVINNTSIQRNVSPKHTTAADTYEIQTTLNCSREERTAKLVFACPMAMSPQTPQDLPASESPISRLTKQVRETRAMCANGQMGPLTRDKQKEAAIPEMATISIMAWKGSMDFWNDWTRQKGETKKRIARYCNTSNAQTFLKNRSPSS